MRTSLKLLALLFIFTISTPCFGWGFKEHIQIARLAVRRLLDDPTTPADFKAWLIKNTPDVKTIDEERAYFMTGNIGLEPRGFEGISHWVCVPDIRANGDKTTLIQSFGVPEQKMHFIDMEMFQKDIDRRVYKHDLSNCVAIKDIPKDYADPQYKEAGLLPFSIKMSYDGLVSSFKENRLEPLSDKPENEDNALRWAGYLAHYIGDNFQPLHSTQDYKSVSYFANKRAAPNIHAEIEWKMNDDKDHPLLDLRKEFWDAFSAELKNAKDTIESTDPWLGTLEQCERSYQYLPLIGLAAQYATGQAGTPDKPTGNAGTVDTTKFFHFSTKVNGEEITVLRMKARQQALAVARVAHLYRQAWDEAHKQ